MQTLQTGLFIQSDFHFVIPLSATYCLGRWKSVRIGGTDGRDGGTTHPSL